MRKQNAVCLLYYNLSPRSSLRGSYAKSTLVGQPSLFKLWNTPKDAIPNNDNEPPRSQEKVKTSSIDETTVTGESSYCEGNTSDGSSRPQARTQDRASKRVARSSDERVSSERGNKGSSQRSKATGELSRLCFLVPFSDKQSSENSRFTGETAVYVSAEEDPCGRSTT